MGQNGTKQRIVRMTENLVHKLGPGWWRDQISPLEISVGKTRRSYYVRWYGRDVEGKTKRMRRKLGWAFQDPRKPGHGEISTDSARKLAIEISAEETMRLGARTDITFAELVERWRGRVVGGDDPETWSIAVSTLEFYDNKLRRWILPYWGKVLARRITKIDVTNLADQVYAENKSASVANGVLSTVSTIFSFAEGAGFVEHNPARKAPRFGKSRVRKRALSDDEIGRLWPVLEDRDWQSTRALRLFLLTAGRRREVLGMRWDELEDDGALWALPPGRRKRGTHTHYVPLTDTAQRLIDGQRGLHETWVFPNRFGTAHQGEIRKALANACRVAGIVNHVRVHDLRRTVGNGIEALGASPWVKAAVLGHSHGPAVTAKNYTSDNPKVGNARAALETWAEHVLSCARAQSGR